MRGAAWPAEVVERALELVRRHGPDHVRIAAELGLDRGQVGNLAARNREGWAAARVEYHQGLLADPATAWRAAAADTAARVATARDAYEWAQVVELPPLDRVPVTQDAAPIDLVASDFHWPLSDPRVEAILFHAVEQLRPRRFILNGDGADLLALSRFPKDARQGKSWPLRDEQLGAKSFWRELRRLSASWGMELYETEANHSGNGVASRWRRYLNDRAPELFGLEGAEDALSYTRFFHPADVAVHLVDELLVAPEGPSPLRILHGWKANKYGGYTARASGDELQGSAMVGHTHRQGYSARRVPAIVDTLNGRTVRAEAVHRSFELGCCCLVGADYAPRADWAQGFAIVTEGGDGAGYGVELVSVAEGRADVAALGRTLRG